MPTPEARRDHEARYGAAREGVCVLAPDWRFRYANASLLEILQLLGRREGVASLWDALPAWRDTPEAESLRRAMDERAGVCFRVARERGAGREWEVEAEPLAGGDLRVHVRRATPHAAARDGGGGRGVRLDAMVSHAPVAMALLDAATLEVREANPACHALFPPPWNAPGALLGHTPAELIPGWERSEVAERVRRVVATGEAWEAAELRVPPAGPRPAWLRVSVHAVDDPGGRRHLLVLAVRVTELVRARRSAEAERRALFEILDTLPVGLVVAWAPEGRVAYVNPAAAALAGRTARELGEAGIGNYLEHWPLRTPAGDPFDPAEIPLVRALRGEATPEVEMVLPLDDGTERTILGMGVPLRDAAGEVERAVVAFYDISERLRLERALMHRQAEAEAAAADAALRAEESRALREIGRALVSELDPARVLELATRAAMELLGARGAYVNAPTDDGELRVGPALGILAEVEGATFPLAGSTVEWLQREGRTVVLDSADEVPAGSVVLALLHRRGVRNLILAPMRAFGQSFGILGVVDRAESFTAEDARVLEALADSAAMAIHNARLHAEERRRADESRALLAAAEALSSTLDPAEVTARIVGIAQELTGAAGAGLALLAGSAGDRVRMAVATGPLAPLHGQVTALQGSFTERVLRDDAPLLMDAGDSAVPSVAHLARLGVGPMALAPLRVGDEPLGVLAVIHPAGAPPFARESLRLLALLADQAAVAVRNARLYETAQEASRAKSDFLATMSHELRTPLNALEGYASLMADEIYGPVNPRQAHALSRMQASQRHLLALIQQVLDVARLEAGAKHPEVEEVNPAALAGSVVDALCGAAEKKGLALGIDAVPVGRIRTDVGMTRQILTNLLGNALKFTEQGGVRVRVRQSASGGVAVEVEDTGPGIPPEHVERIWEPFYQVEPTMTRREGGTGLGLPLAREYARILGGDITVRSEPGAGSTFVLVLPRDFTAAE